MEQAGTMSLESTLFNSYPTHTPTENRLFRYEKNRSEISLEKTINNYLKTPAEMDAEFTMEMNTAKLMSWRQVETYDQYGTVAFLDESITMHVPDSMPSGFMEENY